jgi:hypothetical protein
MYRDEGLHAFNLATEAAKKEQKEAKQRAEEVRAYALRRLERALNNLAGLEDVAMTLDDNAPNPSAVGYLMRLGVLDIGRDIENSLQDLGACPNVCSFIEQPKAAEAAHG